MSIKNKSSPCFPTGRILLEQQGTLSVKKEEAIVASLDLHGLAACTVY